MTPYEFVFRLNDLFSTPLQRIASHYQKVTNGMERRAQAVSRMFGPMGNAMRRSFTAPQGSVAELTRRLEVLKQKASNIDIGINRKGLREANREIGFLENRIDKMQNFGRRGGRGGGSGGGMGWLMSGGVAMALAYGAYNTVEAATAKTVAPAMQMEATKFQLGAMLKSPEAASNLVNQVNAYAPERSSDLLMAGRSLLGAGVKQEDLMSGLKTLNNLAAFSNTDIKELAIIQSKIKATGYVQGDEKDMLVERGININKYLAEVMGIREDKIKKAQEKGLITYDIFQKALERMAGQKGDYANFYERKQQETTQGRVDMAMGKFNMKLAQLGEKILPAINVALDWVLRNAERVAPLLEPFSQLIGAFSPLFTGFRELLKYMGVLDEQNNISKGFVEKLTEAMRVMTEAISELFKEIQRRYENHIKPVIGLFGSKTETPEEMRQRLVGRLNDVFLQEQRKGDLATRRRIRNGMDIESRRAARRGQSEGGGSGSLKGDTTPSKSGLEAAVSGAKSSITNVNVKSLIGELKFEVENVNEAVGDIERLVTDALLRLLSSANSIPE